MTALLPTEPINMPFEISPFQRKVMGAHPVGAPGHTSEESGPILSDVSLKIAVDFSAVK